VRIEDALKRDDGADEQKADGDKQRVGTLKLPATPQAEAEGRAVGAGGAAGAPASGAAPDDLSKKKKSEAESGTIAPEPKPAGAPQTPSRAPAQEKAGGRKDAAAAPKAPSNAYKDKAGNAPAAPLGRWRQGPTELFFDDKGFHVATTLDSAGGGVAGELAPISSAVFDASDPAVRALALHALDLEADAQPHDHAWARRVLSLGELLGLRPWTAPVEEAKRRADPSADAPAAPTAKPAQR
jgi:hypothetical protein